ncbi:hypothetical protein BGZ60DRAFT_419762 [Tricladium varicosporioides]|nr:hypothetical protein BGZ60DRAFT_419762 [Hymenoscyphus varicosporioides]
MFSYFSTLTISPPLELEKSNTTKVEPYRYSSPFASKSPTALVYSDTDIKSFYLTPPKTTTSPLPPKTSVMAEAKGLEQPTEEEIDLLIMILSELATLLESYLSLRPYISNQILNPPQSSWTSLNTHKDEDDSLAQEIRQKYQVTISTFLICWSKDWSLKGDWGKENMDIVTLLWKTRGVTKKVASKLEGRDRERVKRILEGLEEAIAESKREKLEREGTSGVVGNLMEGWSGKMSGEKKRERASKQDEWIEGHRGNPFLPEWEDNFEGCEEG